MTAVLFLSLAAGCAGPELSPEHNIGFVQSGFIDEAVEVLGRQGIHAQPGLQYPGLTGIRVDDKDVYWATRILLQWRRGKQPGAYVTREEFEMGLEYP
jgi:hypothetical protein